MADENSSGRKPSMIANSVKFHRALILLGMAAGAAVAQLPGPAPRDAVRELQSKYQQERAEADKSGLTKKFAPEWFARAEEFAKKGEAALTAGRLLEAREDYHKARWMLPAWPPGLPEHIVRIFGDAKPLRHLEPVTSIAFSPDGSRMATAGKDGVVKMWDAGTGRLLFDYTGHTDAVRGIAFSPDGRQMASSGGDKFISLWDPATGKEVRKLTGLPDFANSVAYSPDGKHLAAACADRNV